MGRFDGVLLASDFDNTLIYTEEALRSGVPVPPLSLRNREALEWFMAEGGRFAVATGRALAAFVNYADGVPMNAPAVVLADEPTGNLDSKNSQEIVQLLKLSNRKYHQTLIIITHDENIALQADRILAIEDSKIVRDEVIRP